MPRLEVYELVYPNGIRDAIDTAKENVTHAVVYKVTQNYGWWVSALFTDEVTATHHVETMKANGYENVEIVPLTPADPPVDPLLINKAFEPLVDSLGREILRANEAQPYVHAEYERQCRMFESALVLYTKGDAVYAKALSEAWHDSYSDMDWYVRRGNFTREYLIEVAGLATDSDATHTGNDSAYVVAVEEALRTGSIAIPENPQYCPECNRTVPADADFEASHMYTDSGMLVIGCEGYWVVDPNSVGIAHSDWQDYRSAE